MAEKVQKLLAHPVLEKAIARLRGWEEQVCIVSHCDTDGICSGTIMLKAMLAAGLPCSLRLIREFKLEEMNRALESGLLILLDMGTGQLRELETLENPNIIILDHHQPPGPHDASGIIELNAHKLGFGGTYEACASTLSYLFALKMDVGNAHLIGDAIIGITGDRQHVPALSGLNLEIVEEGIRKELLLEKKCELNLHEHEVGESLLKSTDPYFTGLCGRKNEVKAFLDDLGIPVEQKLDELDAKQKKRLTEALLLRLLRRCNHVTVEELTCTKFFSKDYPVSAYSMNDYVDACAGTGNETLAIRMLLGNEEALTDAISLFENYRAEIQNALIYLEDMGAKQLESIQYFENKKPSTSGTLAGVGMQFLFEQSKPTLGIARKDDLLKVSGRGTTPLVDMGLNLASAFKTVARNSGGTGGGHPIAAGATVPWEKKDEFLRETDLLVREQMRNS